MAGVSFLLAMVLRVGDEIFLFFPPVTLVQATLVFTAIAAVTFLATNLYRGVWRYASLPDLMAILRAATITIALFLLVLFLWTRLEPMPRSVPFINWLVLMALLGGPRFLYRTNKDRRMDHKLEAEAGRKVPVLLAGVGHEAALFIRALREEPQRIYTVVGMLAEKRKRVGQEVQGVPVVGTIDDLTRAVKELSASGRRPERLILTREVMDGVKVRALLEEVSALGMTMARLPRLTDFRSGAGERLEVRPIDVEDLLGRPQTPLDREAMAALIAGGRVVVTGAGGSIGSELVRQISDFGPSELVLLDASEFNLYSIEAEARARHPRLPCPAVLADVRDRRRIRRLFRSVRPELVFHAAALKHVPLVEANPFEGIMTNAIGTANVADAAVETGAAAMVFVSTDKAINPTSIMGASKRIAERYCQALDVARGLTAGGRTPGTRFVTVRFGNVLGSTGSVVPLFQKQIAAGGPVTVTHPDMKRYFMTTREAVELVLQASALGVRRDGLEGRIFVLDMGEPVRILDLASQMIRLAGLRPDADIAIAYTGIRPGEKLFEELFQDNEALIPTDHQGLLLAAPEAADIVEMRRSLERLARACTDANDARMRLLVQNLVPEFRGRTEVEVEPGAVSA
ncbi:MAG: polysaccharide biosynthesis protein [Rhodospirillales bacterium]|nr:polysaccharide biosynthesis protein [Rhodospirillales bacterium]